MSMPVALHVPRFERECNNCGGIAYAQSQFYIPGKGLLMVCEECGRTFRAHIRKLEDWGRNVNAKIEFFQRRKAWARELLRDAGLTKPGDRIEGNFEGYHFIITIGPRKGVKVWGDHPWTRY